MPTLLHTPKILPGVKTVHRHGNWKIHTSISDNDKEELKEIIRLIETGQSLSSDIYSKRSGSYDLLLQETGILHFHLGGSGSDVLVYLIQYVDDIMLLEINNHKHFDNSGQTLKGLYRDVTAPKKTPIVVKKKTRKIQKSPED